LEREPTPKLAVLNPVFSDHAGGEMGALFKPAFLAAVLAAMGAWLWFLYISVSWSGSSEALALDLDRLG